MKEQTLLEMKNKIETLGKITTYLMSEAQNLKDLGIGTLETIKLMPGYDHAISELQTKAAEDIAEKKLEI